MALRIRATKPEFWESETIGRLDWDTRLILKALEAYVDDNGVGKDSVTLFCTSAFPHDVEKSPEIFAKVSRSLARLSEVGIIVRYSVAGERLVYVKQWKKWQYIDKPKKGRYPRPDGTREYIEVVDETIGAGQGITDSDDGQLDTQSAESYPQTARSVPEECPPIQSGEQGNRGSEERSSLTLVEGGAGGDPANLPVAAKAAPANARGSRLSRDWIPSPSVISAMREQFPGLDLKRVHEEFLDYWCAVPGAKGRKTDWDATFRNRVREVASRNHGPARTNNGIGKPTQKAIGWEAAGAAVLAEMEHDE